MTNITINDAIDFAIHEVEMGNLVVCTAAEYPAIRNALHRQACKWIETDQDIRAQIALMEIKRLDEKFNFTMLG